MQTLVLVAVAVLAAGVRGQNSCKPGSFPTGNCALPNCRCAADLDIPGGLSKDDVPQIVLVTFENAVHTANVGDYEDLFTGTNPNGCDVRGTFFIQDQGSELGPILDLYQKGHEIGAHSYNDSFPADGASRDDWFMALSDVRALLQQVGIKPNDVRGVRGPRLTAGGDNQFLAMVGNGFIYDATCVTDQFIDEGTLKWPYTYDYVPNPKCTIGTSATIPFPGLWQFLVADLVFNGTKCASPAACVEVKTQKDAFDLFYTAFVKHYDGNRAPYMIVINPEWVTVPAKKAGTVQFLQYIRDAFEDTWIIPINKAVSWMVNPTPNSQINNFQPWKC